VTPLVVLDVMRTRIRLRCSVCRQSALFNALSFLHSGSFPSTRVRDADFQRSRWSFLSARRILVIANTLNIVLSSREVAESPCQEVLGSEYWVRTFKISYVDFVPRDWTSGPKKWKFARRTQKALEGASSHETVQSLL